MSPPRIPRRESAADILPRFLCLKQWNVRHSSPRRTCMADTKFVRGGLRGGHFGDFMFFIRFRRFPTFSKKILKILKKCPPKCPRRTPRRTFWRFYVFYPFQTISNVFQKKISTRFDMSAKMSAADIWRDFYFLQKWFYAPDYNFSSLPYVGMVEVSK